jgi:hypothetical protein
MELYSSKLEAKVAAQNRANALILELHPKFREIFLPYLGQKILTANGQLLAKVEKQLPELPNTAEVRAWKQSGINSISLHVSVNTRMLNEHGGDEIAIYAEAYATLVWFPAFGSGIGKPTEIPECPVLRTDYTAEEISKLRKQASTLELELSRVKSALGELGMCET